MGTTPLQTTVAAQGGVFVPVPVRQAILGRLATASAVRRLAQIIPMTCSTLKLPRLDAGLAASWVDEGANAGVDAPSFDSLLLEAHKLSVIVPVTEELLADANTGIAEVVAQILADSFAAKEDAAFLGFDPTGPITGLYEATAAVQKLPSTGDIVTDSAQALAAIEAAGYEPTGFVANPILKARLRAAKDDSGQYIFSPGAGDTPDRLWGVPIVFSRQVPANLGAGSDKTALFAGDWRQLLIGDRQDFTLSRSADATYVVGSEVRSAFQRSEVLLRAEERIAATLATPTAFAIVDLIA